MKRFRSLFVMTTLFFLSCSKIEEPRFRRIDTFRVVNLGLEEVTISFGMGYFNPNNFSVTVKETAANLYLDATFLGHFVQDGPVDVRSNGDFRIVLTGAIPVSTFLKLNLKDVHKREVAIRAEGNTQVGKAGVFINRKIAYEGRHRLDRIPF